MLMTVFSSTAFAQEAEAETEVETEGEGTLPYMFGGQLVRPTLLGTDFALEVGGGGALYFDGTDMYWGGGGGHVFELHDTDGNEVDYFHGELWLGYDMIRTPGFIFSVTGMGGVGFDPASKKVFGVGEARFAARFPLASWFMLGTHLAYRQAFAESIDNWSVMDLSGPIFGLELFLTV